MFDAYFQSPDFRSLFERIWTDEAAARAYRLASGAHDLSTLLCEARCLA